MSSARAEPRLLATGMLLIGISACGVPKQAENAAAPTTPATSAGANVPAAATDAPAASDGGAPATRGEPESAPPPSAPPGSPIPDDGADPIRFPAGGTAVTIAGTAKHDADRRYTLDAKRGQRMRIGIAGSSDALRFAVYPPASGPGGVAMVRGASAVRPFTATLPRDGRYLIQIYRAAGDAAADFRLSVAIDPPGTSAAVPMSQPTTGTPAAIVRDYYTAIDGGDYAAAYRLWENDGQASGRSFASFRQGFGTTRLSHVTITGPVGTEGAAGSSYATVPVAVDATMVGGTQQHFIGSYVLRRVNDVPGSSAIARSWHLYSAKLQPVG